MAETISPYLFLKMVHIVGATILFGFGLGSAFYKYLADREGNLEAIVFTNRNIILGDCLLIAPSFVLQPLTGLLLAVMARIPLDSNWIQTAFVLYALGGGCWIVAFFLQFRMRDLAVEALGKNSNLPERYHRYARFWFWLGFSGFFLIGAIFPVMVFKP